MTWLDDIELIKNKNITDKATRDEISRSIGSFNNRLSDISNSLDIYSKTMECLLEISEYSRKSVQEHFEKFVTYILQYVLGSDYSFHVVWTTGAKNTQVDFLVRSPDPYAKPPYKEEDFILVNPISGKGGGVCDVVAFGLRLAFLTLLKNKAPILLDESFSQLSKSYIPNVSTLLRDVNDKFGYQIIFITHARDTQFTENADYLLTL